MNKNEIVRNLGFSNGNQSSSSGTNTNSSGSAKIPTASSISLESNKLQALKNRSFYPKLSDNNKLTYSLTLKK